jgi:hypothetical protein
MSENAKVTQTQWNAAQLLQSRHGAPDQLVAMALGCGATTVRTRRQKSGWTTRVLPEGFMSADMLREGGASDLSAFDLFDEDDSQPALSEAAIRRAQERLMAMIVNETARVGLGELDPLAVRRLEVMSTMVRAFEKVAGMRPRLGAPGEALNEAEKTAAVLAKMDGRVDELANRRARDIIAQCCQSGECRAVLPDAE